MAADKPAPRGESGNSTYGILDELDRLEEILEQMDELGVTTRAEVEARLAILEAQVGDIDPTPLERG